MSTVNYNTMDEQTYLNFYKTTILGYSKKAQRAIRNMLCEHHAITFDKVTDIFEQSTPDFFSDKNNLNEIIAKTTANKKNSSYFEYWEFIKLYKYSIPLFYEDVTNIIGNSLVDQLKQLGVTVFEIRDFTIPYSICPNLQEAKPTFFAKDGKYFLKFVVQKAKFIGDTYEQIDYRYPIVIFIDPELHIIEVRYDAISYNATTTDSDLYSSNVQYCINWLQENLQLNLFLCNHNNIIEKINDKNDPSVQMFKQMMEMQSGGAAELTASNGRDAVLPFIGELRELISENEELFNQTREIKELLQKYLDDKEATANYPYIYVKWVKPVESQSYIVKITFDYLNRKYTVLQHLTGTCNDLEMGRMNDAIKYLCDSSSFTKGEQI